MKKNIYIFFIVLSCNLCYSQLGDALLPGTLTVNGSPSISQTINDLVTEAGEDDNLNGLETEFNASLVSFVLDSSTRFGIFTIPSDRNCAENVFKYSVYMHTTGVPANVEIQARTIENGGNRFPEAALYDALPIKPLGNRDLRTENSGNYITIPNNGGAAIKVLEFIGCRTDIPVQFKVKTSVKANSGDYNNIKVFYTVVGSTF